MQTDATSPRFFAHLADVPDRATLAEIDRRNKAACATGSLQRALARGEVVSLFAWRAERTRRASTAGNRKGSPHAERLQRRTPRA